jgi:hypothetical protein
MRVREVSEIQISWIEFRKSSRHLSNDPTTFAWVVVPFGILERISIRSYVFATVGTVERPFPAKTYLYLRLHLMKFSSNISPPR